MSLTHVKKPLMAKNTYVLILAGGSGTRFWPLSRNVKPKQFLNLFDDEPLINKTVNRLEGLVPKENIFILTNELQKPSVLELLPDHPPENIFAEPAKRDTAPAVALGIGLIAARDPDAVMMVLPADQLINDTENYQKVMADAVRVADLTPSLVTVGIKPTWPSPSFGYIERGVEVPLDGVENTVRTVERFREKPAVKLAESFLAKGNFSWNAGMFIWSISTVRQELAQHCPQLAGFIDDLVTTEDLEAHVQAEFEKLEAISIDYALMESAETIYTIEATFDWDDVGSWVSVSKYLEKHGSNATNSPLVEEESSENIVYTESGKQVALLGVKDLIVVETGDAILVADRHEADAIKKIVGALPPELQ